MTVSDHVRELEPTRADPGVRDPDLLRAVLEAQRAARAAVSRVEFRFLAVPEDGVPKGSDWLPEHQLTWRPDPWRDRKEWARTAPGYRAARIVASAPVPVEARVVVSYRTQSRPSGR